MRFSIILFLGILLLVSCERAEIVPESSGIIAKEAKGQVVVATINQKGEYVLNQAVLSQTFTDGGKIDSHTIEKHDDGYNLITLGLTISDEPMTVATPLFRKYDAFIAEDAQFYAVCRSKTSCFFCKFNSAKTACDCSYKSCLYTKEPPSKLGVLSPVK